MQETLQERGLPVSGSARKIRRADFENFDLILTMDDFNRREVLALTKSESDRTKVQPFTSFCEEHEEKEVPDPYYGGPEGFELVADLIEDGCQGILRHIEEQLA